MRAVRAVKAVVVMVLILVLPLFAQNAATVRVLDDFENPAAWSAVPSEGVKLTIRSDSGHFRKALRLDFDFQGHGGYAVIHRALPIDLPDNYVLSFWIRGNAPVNNLEFKLIDSTGDNVWWRNQRGYRFQGGWRKVIIHKRQIEFAWGPAGVGDLGHAAAIEFAITAGTGGKGTIWLDDLRLEPREPDHAYDLTPIISASRSLATFPASNAIDTDTSTAWRASSNGESWLTLDFQQPREFSGLTVQWEARRYSTRYQVELSDDGRRWTTAYLTQGGNGGSDNLYLPESESRYLRLHFIRSAGNGQGYGIRSLTVHPVEWAPTINAFFHQLAAESPRGRYPRYLLNEQSYWTMVGVNGDGHRALLGKDGAFEPFAGEFSIEPFLLHDGKLLGWADVTAVPSLEDGYLPIPTVEWKGAEVALQVTAAAIGVPGQSSALVRYRATNRSSRATVATLALTIRPFQVNPPWQFLGVPGGAARIDSLTGDTSRVRVNSHVIIPLAPASRFGAASYDGGDVTEYLSVGRVPLPKRVLDGVGRASGVLIYELELAAGQSKDVFLQVPLSGDPATLTPETAGRALTEVADSWRALVNRVPFSLPDSAEAVANLLRTTIAYMMINRDGPALQPGARSYRRSWIRDGAMISAALLRLGHPEPVREFMEWYAPYQYDSGKVPCCVDARGSDPVPEHDSHGELIHLVAEYYRATGDRGELERLWPHVARAVAYMDSLRRSLRTDALRQVDSVRFFGLMPPSISHEGYSAKPVHSYWDDFFTARGFADAADLARVLGRVDSGSYRAISEEFRHDLLASLRSTIAQSGINYLPGSADLADYDPTSSSIGISPGGMLNALPRDVVEATFDRYFREAMARKDSTGWEAYTPYELRNVGTLVRLGWREKAYQLLRQLLESRRPREWNQWPEVAWRDSTAPKFLGDLPHTWVASDFARSLLDMFAYVREGDSTLVLAAGIPIEWMRDTSGVMLEGLRVGRGQITMSIRREGRYIVAMVEATGPMPQGGVVLRLPPELTRNGVKVNDQSVEADTSGDLRLENFPARVVIRAGN
ncbi:MAG: discoidin domain-containing protein [Gemmatimonadota bacterium]